MFGFGDDRNPANDTVNVMEEILVEYIADVVSAHRYLLPAQTLSTISMSPPSTLTLPSVKAPSLPHARHGYLSKTYGELCPDRLMRRSWLEWRNCSSCRRISSVRGLSLTTRISSSPARSNRGDSVYRSADFDDLFVLYAYRSTGPTVLYILGVPPKEWLPQRYHYHV